MTIKQNYFDYDARISINGFDISRWYVPSQIFATSSNIHCILVHGHCIAYLDRDYGHTDA